MNTKPNSVNADDSRVLLRGAYEILVFVNSMRAPELCARIATYLARPDKEPYAWVHEGWNAQVDAHLPSEPTTEITFIRPSPEQMQHWIPLYTGHLAAPEPVGEVRIVNGLRVGHLHKPLQVGTPLYAEQ